MLVGITDAQGNRCQKDVAIVINAAPVTGPNWSTLVYDRVIHNGGGGSVSALGDAISFDLQAAEQQSSTCDIHGSLTYTGPLANCQLDLHLLNNGPPGGGTMGIYVVQDSGLVLDLHNNSFAYPIGHSYYPFTIAAGVASVIEFRTSFPDNNGYMYAGAGIAWLGVNPGIVIGDATVSNIP